MLTTVTLLVGLAGLTVSVVSVAFLAWQTRAVAKQTTISNAIAGATALKGAIDSLREVLAIFLDRPELRAYFFDGKPCPRRGRGRARVLTIADALADVLESGHLAHELVPATESYEDWSRYCAAVLRTSPTLADLVRRQPDWWPRLHLIIRAPAR
jgi:hypothetical protein